MFTGGDVGVVSRSDKWSFHGHFGTIYSAVDGLWCFDCNVTKGKQQPNVCCMNKWCKFVRIICSEAKAQKPVAALWLWTELDQICSISWQLIVTDPVTPWTCIQLQSSHISCDEACAIDKRALSISLFSSSTPQSLTNWHKNAEYSSSSSSAGIGRRSWTKFSSVYLGRNINTHQRLQGSGNIPCYTENTTHMSS